MISSNKSTGSCWTIWPRLAFYVKDLNLNSESNHCFSLNALIAINADALFADCYYSDWNCCWYFANVNKLELFTHNIANIFYTHVPLKRKVAKKCKPSWFRAELKNAINQRNKLYAKWKSDPSKSNWILIKISRNKVHTITRKAKCVYWRNQFGTNLSNKVLENLSHQNFYCIFMGEYSNFASFV